MNVLFIGDIIARAGRNALATSLPGLRERLGVDLCIGNVENAAGMFGVTERVIDEIVSSGVDVMTSGNHIWDKREGVSLLDTRSDLLRPANYPPSVPGRGMLTTEVGGVHVAVMNLQGRTFMPAIDCPFRAADALLERLPSSVKIILVDFHAEATSEKLCIAYYLDGRISALAGTHTHVPTADERILPNGTAYITDVGMTGGCESVIGVRHEEVLQRFLGGIPVRLRMSHDGPCVEALFVEIDEETGAAKRVVRIKEETGDARNG
jgi:metallophosphoesterase (TIGR00282 family)